MTQYVNHLDYEFTHDHRAGENHCIAASMSKVRYCGLTMKKVHYSDVSS
jgi:hypothetical protein